LNTKNKKKQKKGQTRTYSNSLPHFSVTQATYKARVHESQLFHDSGKITNLEKKKTTKNTDGKESDQERRHGERLRDEKQRKERKEV
jgi:hypothetical protein